jgi:signal transduction histidine kinase
VNLFAESHLQTSEQRGSNLATHLLARREKEVSWIKRELHDRLGQLLFAIGMNIKWACGHCPPEAETLLSQLREITTLIEDGVQAVRRLSADLRSDALNWGSLGLEEALGEYAATLEEQAQVPIQFSSQLLKEEALTPEAAAQMYYVAREALNNAIRHAQATTVTVTLDHVGHELFISVQDDGRGFDLTAQLSTQTVGLEEMFARTRLLGGELNIHTTSGQGTVVKLRAPVTAQGGQTR